MSQTDTFDLVVIGAGTGANGVARSCAKEGWRVAIVDSLPYGGTCALRGCDPKKMLVGVTEGLDWAERMGSNGLRTETRGIDWPEMMAFKRTFTEAMPDRLEAGFAKLGIERLHGTAMFVGPNEVRIGERTLSARYVHVATGARPATLGIVGEELLTSSTQFLELEETPKRIVFVGGGFISFEFAHIARRSGALEVTIVHRGARPLVRFDPDLVGLQVERTRALGIDVRLEACVVAIEATTRGLSVVLDTPSGRQTIECDLAVHGAGRVPNLDDLELDSAGVTATSRGIAVGASMRSVSNPSVFAAGDCADTGAPNLTPISANEARIAAKNLLAGEDVRTIEYPERRFHAPPHRGSGPARGRGPHRGLRIRCAPQEDRPVVLFHSRGRAVHGLQDAHREGERPYTGSPCPGSRSRRANQSLRHGHGCRHDSESDEGRDLRLSELCVRPLFHGLGLDPVPGYMV